MTLAEWLDEYRYLLDTSAEDELKEVFAQNTKVEKFTSTNIARDEICPHYQRVLYVDVCTCAGKLSPVA